MQSTYQIDGMTQWSNADAVAVKLSVLPEVQDVHMDIVAGTALITSETVLPVETVRAAVAEAGFSLAPQALPRRGIGIVLCGLVVALITGYSLGKATTPSEAAEPAVAPSAHHGGGAHADGLAISSNGYTLVPAASRFAAPGAYPLSFVVKDMAGATVTRFATVHEKQLHLVVARRDLTGYQHLHPIMSAAGVWNVTANFDASGPWRVYADFTAINQSFSQIAVTLGHDIHIGGDFQPRALPEQSKMVSYVGKPQIGVSTPLLFGVAGATLQPYLGSYGHLVVLREGDMAYIHVHPEPQLSDGRVKFWLTLPSQGSYRMFFDHQIGGEIHTFAVDLG